jgi:hypothetical protein
MLTPKKNSRAYSIPGEYKSNITKKSVSKQPVNNGFTLKQSNKSNIKNISTSNIKRDNPFNRPDQLSDDVFEIIDPSGISSWDDVAKSYKKSGLSSETGVELFGAIPIIGKLGKVAKAIDSMKGAAKTSRQLNSAKKTVKVLGTTAKYGPKTQKSIDAYQAYSNRKNK